MVHPYSPTSFTVYELTKLLPKIPGLRFRYNRLRSERPVLGLYAMSEAYLFYCGPRHAVLFRKVPVAFAFFYRAYNRAYFLRRKFYSVLVSLQFNQPSLAIPSGRLSCKASGHGLFCQECHATQLT